MPCAFDMLVLIKDGQSCRNNDDWQEDFRGRQSLQHRKLHRGDCSKMGTRHLVCPFDNNQEPQEPLFCVVQEEHERTFPACRRSRQVSVVTPSASASQAMVAYCTASNVEFLLIHKCSMRTLNLVFSWIQNLFW